MPSNSSAGWRRLLKVPWIARRSNLSILREINPEYSLEGLMLKHFVPTFWSPDTNRQLIGKVVMLEKIEGRRRRGHQRLRRLDGITDAMKMNLRKLWEMVRDRQARHDAVHGVAKSWTQLGN